MNNLELKGQFVCKIVIFQESYFKVDLWQMSNGKEPGIVMLHHDVYLSLNESPALSLCYN